jgi:type IV fimbrial biogenesis protein FimT
MTDQRRRVGGFTLVELMITVAIVAVLASLAVPSLRDWIQQKRVLAAAERLVSDLELAQAAAVKRDRDITVHFAGSGSTAWCWGLDDSGGDCDCAAGTGCQIVAGPDAVNDARTFIVGNGSPDSNDEPFRGVTMSQNFGDADTGFESVRGTALENGTVTFVGGDHQMQVRLSNLGRVRVCDANDTFKRYDACP